MNQQPARQLKIWLPTIRTGTGSDVFTLRLADGLAVAGHIPIVQFFDRRFEFAPWLLSRVSPPPGTHLVHANSWNAYAFKRDGIPLVVTEHHYIGDPQFQCFRSPGQSAYHRLHVLPGVHRSYAAADALTAVSLHTARAIERQHHIDVRCIHNWLDTSLFKPAPEKPTEREHLRCLFVGNPARRKGSDILPALADLLPANIQIHYLGGLREKSRSDVAQQKLIPLPRHAPEAMPALYQQMDVALIPTRYEAFGYVALEAMACGLPVAGFDSTGTAEICRNGQTALLTPVDDLPALAASLTQLQQDPALRLQLGRNGRQHACTNFTVGAAIQAYLQVYQQVLRQ